jgi:hypothetical protein
MCPFVNVVKKSKKYVSICNEIKNYRQSHRLPLQLEFFLPVFFCHIIGNNNNNNNNNNNFYFSFQIIYNIVTSQVVINSFFATLH